MLATEGDFPFHHILLERNVDVAILVKGGADWPTLIFFDVLFMFFSSLTCCSRVNGDYL